MKVQVNFEAIELTMTYICESGSVWGPVSTSELTDFQKTWHEHYAINAGNSSVAIFDFLQGVKMMWQTCKLKVLKAM